MTCLHNIIWGYKKHFLGRNIKKSAASHMQRYAFLLKDARNYWKMFESEEDKKVYPRLPDVWGKKNTPYYILFQSKHDGNFYGAGNHLAFPIRNKARHQLNYSQSLFVEQRVIACLHRS